MPMFRALVRLRRLRGLSLLLCFSFATLPGAARAQLNPVPATPVAAPAPAAPNLDDIVKRLGDDRFRTREQASRELQDGLEKGTIKPADVKKALENSTDPEVRQRLRRALQRRIDQLKNQIEAIEKEMERIRERGLFDDPQAKLDSSRGGDGLWAQTLELRDAALSLEIARAQALIDELSAQVAALPDDGSGSLAAALADLAALRQALLDTQAACPDCPETEGAGSQPVAIPGPGPADTGRTFRYFVADVIVPGTSLFFTAEPAELGAVPPAGYAFAGAAFILLPDGSLTTAGQSVAIEFEPDVEAGEPAFDPATAQVVRLSAGGVQPLATAPAGDGLTYSAFSPEAGTGPDGAQVFALIVPLPAPLFAADAAVDLNDILKRMGDDSFDVRQKASEDLEDALKNGKLTDAQKACLVRIAYGAAQGSDPEVANRVRKLVQQYLKADYDKVAKDMEEITAQLKITIIDNKITYTFSDFNGRFTVDPLNTDFQRFQRLVDKLREQVLQGDYKGAKETLDDIAGFFDQMSSTRVNDIGLGNGGLDRSDVIARVGRVRDLIDEAIKANGGGGECAACCGTDAGGETGEIDEPAPVIDDSQPILLTRTGGLP